MTRVKLPPGCYGTEMPDGTKYTNRKSDGGVRGGGTIDMDDHHASQIATSSNGRLGLISAALTESLGTKKGRRCEPCGRLWQAWSEQCPRCGHDTVAA